MTKVHMVKEFMDKKFVTLDPDINVYDAIKILLAKKITSAAVVDKEGNLVGILSEKDCLNTLVYGIYEGLPGKNVSEYMTKEVVTIDIETDVLTVAATFLKNSFRRLLILDQGKLVGQITRRDLLRVIQKLEKKVYNPITGKFRAVDYTSVVGSKETED